ncbi:hypothetical protein [Frateuria aurantia]|uniref:Uncharacterized protein n=1 Tax=Frateuria aurantia (strain ATCC 33424 / DSM 6220 / KCTC 2777 / LMG 1558 / NBRC 3245 / NCIMB 13370) TaxID=767434 RepID=H8L0M4_FRAAD|nr:hypothetical protein [Frateuria aurantia]AFC84650.1 hypothetical protein Fraau_0152 [Frateuria aurantia DSM 6220]
MKMRQALIGAIAYAMVAALPLQAKANDTLAAQMGKARFHAAGLDQLSPAQLDVLQDWLARHTRPLPVVVAPSQARSARLAAAGGMVEGQQGGLVSGDIAGDGENKRKMPPSTAGLPACSKAGVRAASSCWPTASAGA